MQYALFAFAFICILAIAGKLTAHIKRRRHIRRCAEVHPLILRTPNQNLRRHGFAVSVTMIENGRYMEYPVQIKGWWVNKWHVIESVQALAMAALPGEFDTVNYCGRHYRVELKSMRYKVHGPAQMAAA